MTIYIILGYYNLLKLYFIATNFDYFLEEGYHHPFRDLQMY